MSILTDFQICVDLCQCGKLDYSSHFFFLLSLSVIVLYSKARVLRLCSTPFREAECKRRPGKKQPALCGVKHWQNCHFL